MDTVAFKLKGSSAVKYSNKVIPGNLDEALAHRLADHKGKFCLERWHNHHAVDRGPWRIRGVAVETFTNRLLSEAKQGQLYRIESQVETAWWLQIDVVDWPMGERVIAAAKTQIGVPYVFGTAIPGVSFDCSGLTMWCWSGVGVELPHEAEAQRKQVPAVSDPIQGDLVFFDYENKGEATHVGLYLQKGGAYGYGRLIDTRNPYNAPVGIRDIEAPAQGLIGFGRPRPA